MFFYESDLKFKLCIIVKFFYSEAKLNVFIFIAKPTYFCKFLRWNLSVNNSESFDI